MEELTLGRCKRLNLQPLAYLWQRNQEDLLQEMISSNIQAIIIKVAALGLDPDKHLGKTLDQMQPYLLELSRKYGVHVCGEGGEYETFTLDCPLFKKKIIVDSSEVVIHSADAFAPVAYLRFLELHLEDKVSPVPDHYGTSNYIHNS
ncbi:PREDICTED: diphthine--ammonia ligase-like [Hipposideros armiger]|uniref:Diphthine--ammonia ligase n=1 Tax=Hipposideros armiger TaxID=186990 RepID=A0A8B7RZQ7_HIPAR|nr:PREDICTED: diphthine--ammonia ligase-like [Hipposideros armiger]